MFMFNVLANGSVSDVLMLILMIMAGISFVILVWITDGFACGDTSQHQNRPTPQRRTPITPKPKKQNHENMKQIAVKRNGQLKKYRINKYGEIFEE